MESTTITKACLIPVCKNEKFSLVHKFPADSERFAQWITAIQPDKPIEKLQAMTPEGIRKRFFICSRHFAKASYKNAESRSLNFTAVPSLNIVKLEDLGSSKAGLSDSHIEPAAKTSDIPKVEQSFVKSSSRILNFNNSPTKKLRIVKRSVKKVPLKESFKLETPENEELEIIDEPPPKRIKADSKQHRNDQKLIVATSSTKISTKAEASLETTSSQPLIESQPSQQQNKLLALIEVTPEQYQTLSSSLTTAERSEHVSSLLSFIAKNDLDPVNADNEIEVELQNGTKLKIDPTWLRDHCRCDHCYDFSNYQRKISVLDIAEDIQAKSFNVGEETLNVVWNDDHESTYEMDFLVENLNDENFKQLEVCLWNKELLEIPFQRDCRVAMRDYMSDPQVSKKVLESLHIYGIALIDGVQPTQQNTEFVIRQLFPIHKTLFGEMWSFSDDKTHSDSAYSNIYLGAHNDNTYFNDAAGLQIFHCIQHSGSGGENFLVDGFRAAENIKANSPDVFKRLVTTIVTAEYKEDGRHHKHSAPIINLCPLTQEIVQVRFNLNDRAPLKMNSTRKIRQFYDDLKVLSRELENPENRITFKLEPGTVLIFDNWRVLHGRCAYTGKRTMTGCYVSRTEYQSCLRVNGFIE